MTPALSSVSTMPRQTIPTSQAPGSTAWRDKAATFALAEDLGGESLLRLVVEETHSCYLGDRTHRHAWGYGCGECPACELRAAGYDEWVASK